MPATAPRCVWAVGAQLGEGPLWSAAEGALWFVDIKRHHVHRYGHDSGERQTWTAPFASGFIAPSAKGGFIVGAKDGLHRFDPVSGRFEHLTAVEPDRPGNRLNDGVVDPAGRLWFGSMDDGETEPTGRLYRMDADDLRPMDDGYVITNGPAFSPDGRTLYHTDTLDRTIWAFDVDERGDLSNKRLFVRLTPEQGYPDGPVVDSAGRVWTSQFAGWAALCYSPEGVLLETVRFPCANITKLAFAGPDLKTVYATTAAKDLSPAQRDAQPLAGGLFRFDVDVPGQAPVAFLYG